MEALARKLFTGRGSLAGFASGSGGSWEDESSKLLAFEIAQIIPNLSAENSTEHVRSMALHIERGGGSVRGDSIAPKTCRIMCPRVMR